MPSLPQDVAILVGGRTGRASAEFATTMDGLVSKTLQDVTLVFDPQDVVFYSAIRTTMTSY